VLGFLTVAGFTTKHILITECPIFRSIIMNLDLARNMADPVSDQLVKLFFEYAGLVNIPLLFTTDWEEIEKKFPQLKEAITAFRTATESPLLPDEIKVLKKANAFYQTNKQYIFLALGFLSLPYC